MPKVLMFTLAAAGYDWLYHHNIQSHKAYARKHAYNYIVANRPRLTTLGLDVVWLKIYLLREAMKSNYDWLVCLDADTEIREPCPAIDTLDKPAKSIYLAQGYSGRFNSGVIILKNDKCSKRFINSIIKHQFLRIAREDDVGWGENGHVIHFAKNNPSVCEIDKRWNNNHSPDMDDFIRHFSAGPLRNAYRPGLLCKTLWFSFKALNTLLRRLSSKQLRDTEVKNKLENTCLKIMNSNF